NFTAVAELLRAGECWGAYETRLCLIHRIRFRSDDPSHTAIDYFDQQLAASIRLDHQIGRFEITMHNAAWFPRGKTTHSLLDHFKRERQWERSGPFDPSLQRFAFDKLHRVKVFAVLFPVMSDPCDVRVMNLRGGARFTQKAGACNWIFRQLQTDNFECNERI